MKPFPPKPKGLLNMSRSLTAVEPDYAMPGPAPDLETAYAKMQAQHGGLLSNVSTDSEIVDFVNSLKPYVMSLPPKLQLKFSNLESVIGATGPSLADMDVYKEKASGR